MRLLPQPANIPVKMDTMRTGADFLGRQSNRDPLDPRPAGMAESRWVVGGDIDAGI